MGRRPPFAGNRRIAFRSLTYSKAGNRLAVEVDATTTQTLANSSGGQTSLDGYSNGGGQGSVGARCCALSSVATSCNLHKMHTS
jgi:hypothetical protein